MKNKIQLSTNLYTNKIITYSLPINTMIGTTKQNSTFTLLQFYEMNGKEIPQLCYCNELFILGVCRMCAVFNINMGKLIMSCATEITNSVSNISINSYLIWMHRSMVMNLHLSNHPLDCPICDQASECDLQDTSFFTSEDYTARTIEQVYSTSSFITAPAVKATMTRCILCSRCVTWTNTKIIDNQLGFLGRGRSTEIGIFNSPIDSLISSTLQTSYSLTLVDICPVGAFTANIDKFTFRSHHSNTFIQMDSIVWARPTVEVHLNAGVMKMLPIAPREDLVLQMKSSYPILSDFSRLSLFDMVDFLNNFFSFKPSLIDKKKVTTTSLFNSFMNLENSSICTNILDPMVNGVALLQAYNSISSKNIRLNKDNSIVRCTTKRFLVNTLQKIPTFLHFCLYNLHTIDYLYNQKHTTTITPTVSLLTNNVINVIDNNTFKIQEQPTLFKTLQQVTNSYLNITNLLHNNTTYNTKLMYSQVSSQQLFKPWCNFVLLNTKVPLNVFNNYRIALDLEKTMNIYYKYSLFSETTLIPISSIHLDRFNKWYFSNLSKTIK